MRDKPSTMGNHIRESSRDLSRHHAEQPVNTASALADPTQLHIEQLQPQSPMTGIRLIIQQIHQTSPQKSDLFIKTQDTDRAQLLDRLTARLGPECLKAPCRLQDPRPEYANQLHDERNVYPLPDIPPRPIWLLNPPESLGQSPEKSGAYPITRTRADRIWLVGL